VKSLRDEIGDGEIGDGEIGVKLNIEDCPLKVERFV
jgi:hypothetical protein